MGFGKRGLCDHGLRAEDLKKPLLTERRGRLALAAQVRSPQRFLRPSELRRQVPQVAFA